MSKHVLKFYPVDNGDTALITLIDKTTILIDVKIRDGEVNSAGNNIYPVKRDLLDSIQRRNKIPFVDLFILTHPDEDHCLGFEKNFYCGDPDKYSDSHRDTDEILVDELWVTSMLFNGATNDDAKAMKKEAERRRKLWVENKLEKDKPGNRIRIIGYDGDVRFENVPNSVPGETLNLINGKRTSDFEFFVHAPFKNQLIQATAEKDKNFSSIAMQARFKINSFDSNWACLYLFGGDADHNIWAEILNKSEANGNKDKLKWDIFMAPHHCSWTYFNDVPYDAKEGNKSPKDSSLRILDYKNSGAKIISSSKPIVNNDDNPPHFQAKQQYLKKVAASEFLNTALEPNQKNPEPIVFEVSLNGVSRIEGSLSLDEKLVGAAQLTKKSVVTGNWCAL